MLTYPHEKIALFIDGSNLHTSARTLGIDIDYKKLLAHFAGMGTLVRALYYTALTDEAEYSPLRPLVDWLDYNGYTLVTKPVKEFTDSMGRRRIKGNMDVEIAVDIIQMADHLDHIVLFSGDGDFRRLIEAVQAKGVRTTVISTARTSPPMIADELRRQADNYIDLNDLAVDIARKVQQYETTVEPLPVVLETLLDDMANTMVNEVEQEIEQEENTPEIFTFSIVAADIDASIMARESETSESDVPRVMRA